MHMFYWVRKGI